MSAIIVSAAEGSGDSHLARLVRELRVRRPDLRFEGFGGELLRAAGCRLHADLVAHASMGLGFLSKVGRYLRVIAAFDRLLREVRPSAVLLVDSPGLHFIFARLARWRGVPVVYYILPQIWAWAPWRRAKVLRYTDLLLAILPFEEDLYRNLDVPVVYVGHPLGDSLGAVEPGAGRRVRESLRIPADARVVGIIPGSREHEVRDLMPLFRGIVERMGLDPSRHRLLVSSFREDFRVKIEEMLMGCRIPHEVLSEDFRAITLASDIILAKSGTSSLEAAYFEKPMIVLYKAGRIARFLFSQYRVTPFFALPNILGMSLSGGEPTVPERLCDGREAPELAPVARALLDPGPARDDAVRRLRRLKEVAFAPGATARAAGAFLEFLGAREEGAPTSPRG
jgi:lipid-A-disaccharide synthase